MTYDIVLLDEGSMSDCDRYNRVMSTTALPKGQVESFFFKANDPARGFGLWIKFTILIPSPGGAEPTASVWVARTAAGEWKETFVARETVPLRECSYSEDAVGMKIGKSSFWTGGTRGCVTDIYGNVLEWDIAFDPECRPLRIFPHKRFLKTPSPWFKTFTPYADSRARGFFSANGIKTTFEDSQAMQGHNWGHAHVPAYAWSHCNSFENSPGTVFEGFSARVPLFGRLTRWASAAVLRHEDRYYHFNHPFRAFNRNVLVNRQSWSFTLRNKEYLLQGIAIAPRQDFIGLNYPNPDGSSRLCVNSNVANLTLELVRIQTEERVVRLSASHGAMIELVSLENWPDVCVYI